MVTTRIVRGLCALIVAGWLMTPQALRADPGQQVTREQVRQALVSGARYAADFLIGPDGKARGDYDMIAGRWYDYEPAWHTGQVIFGLVEAYRVTGDQTFLAAARRAGDWWIGLEFKEPHKLAGLINAYHGDRLGRLINVTTITDGTNGLFELSRATGDPRYADTATRSGRWLLANTYIPDEGLFYNIIDPDTGQVWKDKSPHHKDVANPTLLQVARPNSEGYLFKDMCAHTGDRRYCQVFLDVADKLLDRQGAHGMWMDFEPNHPDKGRFHPRFNLWYAESLLEAYDLTGKRAYLEAALATARGMARAQQKSGVIHYVNYLDGRTDRSSLTGSAVSFAGVVWLRLQGYGVGGEFEDNIDRAVRWVIAHRFAEDHPDPNLRGAFLETRLRTTQGKPRLRMRDIATAFGLRFLAAYYRRPES